MSVCVVCVVCGVGESVCVWCVCFLDDGGHTPRTWHRHPSCVVTPVCAACSVSGLGAQGAEGSLTRRSARPPLGRPGGVADAWDGECLLAVGVSAGTHVSSDSLQEAPVCLLITINGGSGWPSCRLTNGLCLIQARACSWRSGGASDCKWLWGSCLASNRDPQPVPQLGPPPPLLLSSELN